MIHEQEWAASVREAFGTCNTVQLALDLHHGECAKIAAGLSPGLLDLLRACLPLHYPFRLQALQHSSKSSCQSGPVLVRLYHSSEEEEEEVEEDLGIEIEGDLALF